jgi:ERCC4-type nuclease
MTSVKAALIDSREPEWVQQLSFGGAITAVTTLDYGDLLITTADGDLLAIERKTPGDLLNSIASNRLWNQLAGLVQRSRWAYLVITGEMRPSSAGKVVTEHGENGWEWDALQGALLKAQELGAMVINASAERDYEVVIMRLAARDRARTVRIEPVKVPAVVSEGEKILLSLPGIGLEKVGPLLEYASSAAWALQFLTDVETPGHLSGIGPGTKAAIRRALGLADGQEIAVVYGETGNPVNKNEGAEHGN